MEWSEVVDRRVEVERHPLRSGWREGGRLRLGLGLAGGRRATCDVASTLDRR